MTPLAEQLAEAHETIRQLRAALVPTASIPRYPSLNLSRTETCIINCLMDGNLWSDDALQARSDVINRRLVDGTFSVKITISRLRKKLPDGVAIENVWGEGYTMPAASIAIEAELRYQSTIKM